MTVPGVNLIVAATFLAAVGDIRRFATTNRVCPMKCVWSW
jgi:transposase